MVAWKPKTRKLSKGVIRKRRLRYLKRSKVLTPGNRKLHKKKIESAKEEFLKQKEDFGFEVHFKGGKRKRGK